MDIDEALKIVLELAEQNALDMRDIPNSEIELVEECERQRAALEAVQNFYDRRLEP